MECKNPANTKRTFCDKNKKKIACLFETIGYNNIINFLKKYSIGQNPQIDTYPHECTNPQEKCWLHQIATFERIQLYRIF